MSLEVSELNNLLFENEKGEGDLVHQKDLNKLIKSIMPALDVVFVAACQSEFVGEIFQKCGAKHVICVKQKEHVLDEAAIYFTKRFYTQILNQV